MKTIKDEILELVREDNNTDIDNISLSYICLARLMKEPFFDKRRQDLDLGVVGENQGYTIFSSSSRSGYPYSAESYFDFEIQEESDFSFDIDDGFWIKESNFKYFDNEKVESLKRMREIFNQSNNMRGFVDALKSKTKEERDLISVAKYVMGDEFKKIESFLQIIIDSPEGVSRNKELGVDVWLGRSKTGNIDYCLENEKYDFQRKSKIRDSEIAFLLVAVENSGEKVRASRIVYDDEYFLSFIRFFDYELDGRLDIRDKSVRRGIVKDICKREKLAFEFFKKDCNEVVEKISDIYFKKKREEIVEKIDNFKVKTKEELFDKYRVVVDPIIDKLRERYPFISKPGIDKSEIELSAATYSVDEEGEVVFPEHNGRFNIQKGEVSVIDIKEPKEEEIGKYDTPNIVKKDKLLHALFDSYWSISGSSSVGSKYNGFKLLEEDNFMQTKEKIYFKLSYHGINLGFLKAERVGNCILNVRTTEISDMFKGEGLGYELYDFVSDYCVNNKMVLKNTMYTEEGMRSITKIKEKLSKEKPSFIHIESDYQGEGDDFLYLARPSLRMEVVSGKYDERGSENEFEYFKRVYDYFRQDEDRFKKEIKGLIDSGDENRFSIERISKEKSQLAIEGEFSKRTKSKKPSL